MDSREVIVGYWWETPQDSASIFVSSNSLSVLFVYQSEKNNIKRNKVAVNFNVIV